MAYTKHEWVTGEIITAANLNHIEDGIASKLDSESVVNRQDVGVPGSALDALQANPNVPGSLAAQIQEAGESSKAIVLTQAEYDALSDEEKDSDNVYYISDAPFESSNVVPLTRAQYDALSDATKMDGRFYYITDEAEVAKSLVVQTNVNSTETVPSSAVVYGLSQKIDTWHSFVPTGSGISGYTASRCRYTIIGNVLFIAFNIVMASSATSGAQVMKYSDFGLTGIILDDIQFALCDASPSIPKLVFKLNDANGGIVLETLYGDYPAGGTVRGTVFIVTKQ